MKKLYIIECCIWAIIALICFIDSTVGLPIFYGCNLTKAVLTMFCVGRPIGAKKHLQKKFVEQLYPADIDLRGIVSKRTKQAFKVILLWVLFLIIEMCGLRFDLLNERMIVLAVIALRIMSNLFVLIWCPFGAIMHNKCCTECRIFNWDELMVNSPMIFVLNFASALTLLIALFIFVQWEIAIAKYPERFVSETNKSIACKCSACTLCGRCKRKNGQWSLVLRDFLL